MIKITTFIAVAILYQVLALADITREEVCSSSGQKTVTVVRYNPIRFAYALLRGVDAGFPDLNDKFYLPKAQRVRIFYTINLWSTTQCSLATSVMVDEKRQSQFNVMTTYTQDRTHTASYQVWLEAGYHYVYVTYYTNCNIVNMPPNGEHKWWYGLLQIQYKEYS